MAKQMLLPKKVAKISGIKKAAKAHHNAGMKKMQTSGPAIHSASLLPPNNTPSNMKADITQSIKAAIKKHAGGKKNLA